MPVLCKVVGVKSDLLICRVATKHPAISVIIPQCVAHVFSKRRVALEYCRASATVIRFLPPCMRNAELRLTDFELHHLRPPECAAAVAFLQDLTRALHSRACIFSKCGTVVKNTRFSKSSAYQGQACLEMQNCGQTKSIIDDSAAFCVNCRKNRYGKFIQVE